MPRPLDGAAGRAEGMGRGQLYLRCLEMYYGRPVFLGFAGRDGCLHKISCQSGIQQGDPQSSAMYCLAQHPTLMHMAYLHTEVYLVAYARLTTSSS
eukprot:2364899-Rhodomonas_salina.1